MTEERLHAKLPNFGSRFSKSNHKFNNLLLYLYIAIDRISIYVCIRLFTTDSLNHAPEVKTELENQNHTIVPLYTMVFTISTLRFIFFPVYVPNIKISLQLLQEFSFK